MRNHCERFSLAHGSQPVQSLAIDNSSCSRYSRLMARALNPLTIFGVSLLALPAATACSMLVSRFAPGPEADRLLAGAVTFPLWWIGWVIFALMGRRGTGGRSVALAGVTVLAALAIFAW